VEQCPQPGGELSLSSLLLKMYESITDEISQGDLCSHCHLPDAYIMCMVVCMRRFGSVFQGAPG
jgi:hypothetical protein